MKQTQDKQGVPYAKLTKLSAGDAVITDTGFTCTFAGKHTVQTDGDGRLFIVCKDGRHYLDGQADDGEHLVGIYRA